MKVALGKAVRFKLPCLSLFFLFVILYTLGSLYWIFTQNSLTEASFLETKKCPVCYGDSMCYTLLNNKVNLVGYSKFISFDLLNSKKIYFAKHVDHNSDLVLKKLASDADFRDLDDKICKDSKMTTGCDVSNLIRKTSLVTDIAEDDRFAKHLQGTSSMFACTSTRLLGSIFARYKEKTTPGKISTRDKVQILITAMLNSEPLILQTFPSSDGWPFPEYVGACGRYIVVSNGGKPLSDFYTSQWSKRVDIAYQLMKIADTLTNNKDEFALYLTDVTYDNFVVDTAGKVTLIDLEDIVVVDKQAIKAAKLEGWEELHESIFSECPKKSFKLCHSFSEPQLCSRITSDHNYYVVCRYILSHYADSNENGKGHTDGLLHDMPETAKNEWDLEYLLNECVVPTRQRGRIQVVHKLIDALDNLRLKMT